MANQGRIENWRKKAWIAATALRELGPGKLLQYGIYRAGLKTGRIQRQTTPYDPSITIKQAAEIFDPGRFDFAPHLAVVARDHLVDLLGDHSGSLLEEAEEIVAGKVRLFGGSPVPLHLKPPQPLLHWSLSETPKEVEDIKLIWEPARMGWAFPLGRAYCLTGDDRFPEAFWKHTETFLEANPPNLGPNWASAQEAALRILAMSFAGKVFFHSPASTRERKIRLIAAIIDHAARIPPTLAYARSQNNNHLLTEAAGLYTAGVLLRGHPLAMKWRRMGWVWFHRGIENQIQEGGVYVQHSTNYHRLMLQTSLWFLSMARSQLVPLPFQTQEKLGDATRWLLAHVDPDTGLAPNLGHNDGAHILPLAAGSFGDYRSTVQAAALHFLGAPCLPEGPWDEMLYWLKLHPSQRRPRKRRLHLLPEEIRLAPFDEKPVELTDVSRDHYSHDQVYLIEPEVDQSTDENQVDLLEIVGTARRSRAFLRAAQFCDRPAHADQLHADLWIRGVNIAIDAGTFRYSAPPPWDNQLALTATHNTITVDGHDQMERMGKFLWLDWARAQVSENEPTRITAEHYGYARLGIVHRRTLSFLQPASWVVEDQLLSARGSEITAHTACLHWLLPDFPWKIEDDRLLLQAPFGQVVIYIKYEGQPAIPHGIQLLRAGEVIFGQPDDAPLLGWYSPTYNKKIPALSLRMAVTARPPISFASIFNW